MHRRATERTFEIMRLGEAKPFFYPGITFTLLIVALELISRHLDQPHTSYM
jgi:hypothetical protein